MDFLYWIGFGARNKIALYLFHVNKLFVLMMLQNIAHVVVDVLKQDGMDRFESLWNGCRMWGAVLAG
jgi:hypothetical protein